MRRLTFSALTIAELRQVATLTERGVVEALWQQIALPVDADEREELGTLSRRLRRLPISPLNEATLWARAIYPLLTLAETDEVIAWSQVPLAVSLHGFTLEGSVDGVLARGPSGIAEAPYFVVLEAKRGLEATNPQPQLYGQLLAVATLHQAGEVFGAYTVADSWTFVRAVVTGGGEQHPALVVELSPEMAERTEAETILGILKGIVARQTGVNR